MRVRVKRKKVKDTKKDIVKIAMFSFLYMLVFAIFLAFQGERPTSYKSLVNEGNNYVNQGKIALAIEHYQELARKFPTNYYSHYKLGKLYKTAKELDKAKIELFYAIKLDPDEIQPHVELANLYMQQNDYELAENVIKLLEDKSYNIREIKGDFYLKTYEKYQNKQDKILALKKAYRYLKDKNTKKFKQVKELLTESFFDLSSEYIQSDDFEEAVKTLNIALKYSQNPEIYNRLADLYIGKDDKKSFEYTKNSLKLDHSKENKQICYNLFLEIGKSYLKKNDEFFAKYVFKQAKKINPEKAIPYYKDKNLLVNIISTQFNEDSSGKIILPGISFKITNVSNEDLGYLNTKVVFMKGNEILSESKKLIADKKAPLPSDSVTSSISVFADRPISDIMDIELYSVKIYLSTTNPEKWLLYRYAPLTK